MSSVSSSLVDIPKRIYVSTGAFATHIYTYTKTYNSATYTWSGSLTNVSFDAGLNRAGVHLRETGKKLYKDANPGVDRYMVGVYHVDIGTAFIDPNCSVFALFNGDKPEYIETAQDDHASPDSETMGNPVYTIGDITTTQGNITATLGNIAASAGTITAYGNIASTNGGITALRPIRSSTVTALTPGTDVVINPALGQVFTLTIGTGVTTRVTATSPNNVPGQVIYIIVTGSGAGSAIDFNVGFRSQSLGLITMNGTIISIAFVSDGTNFYEISRTGALAQ